MTGHHLHLLLNHFPIVGLVLSILILGLGLIRTNTEFIRAGLLIVVLAGVLAVPTYLSGESAEEVLEHAPRFIESLVEAHEESAEFAIWMIEILAIAAVGGLYLSLKKNTIPRYLIIFIIVMQFFTGLVIARTSNLGGQISHPEIRGATTPLPHSSDSN